MTTPDRFQELYDSLLIAACKDGSYHQAYALLNQGADPQCLGNAPIIESAAYGRAEFIRLLHHFGADPKACNDSAICYAAEGGHLDAVKVLLELGADFTVHEHGPLRRAEANGHTDVAEFLRDHGSWNRDTEPDNGETLRRAIARKLKVQKGITMPPGYVSGGFASEAAPPAPQETDPAAPRPTRARSGPQY